MGLYGKHPIHVGDPAYITKLQLKYILLAGGACSVLCDISTGTARPRKKWKRHIFDTIHALAHLGARTTKRLITSKFVWHGLNKEVTHWARSCLVCQRSKVQTHIRAPLGMFAPVSRRFDHVHVDLVGPLPESQGFKYLLTIVDRFTRWPEVIPITDMETQTVAKAYLLNWVAHFSVPSSMTSDRGTQFISELWKAMLELLGTNIQPTKPTIQKRTAWWRDCIEH